MVGNQSMVGRLLFGICAVATACSPIERASSNKNAQQSDNASTNPAPQGAPTLTLPSWCSMKQTQDQVCFKCDRLSENTSIPYEQCLTAAESFQASTDCTFQNELTKTISCDGTSSGRTFIMDISTAKEKIAAVVPALMLTVEILAKQKLTNNQSAKTVIGEFSAFVSGRINSIANGLEPEATAADLLLFVNRHANPPLNQEQANLFKKTATDALTLLPRDLSGKKDYSLSQSILRLMGIARTLPDDILGDAKPLLTGAGLAELLSEDRTQTLIRSFSILNPSILGVKSADELITELINAP